jgi:hypothetical protein
MAHNENVHNIRCDNELWDRAVAKEPGELPERIREFLEDYVGDKRSIQADYQACQQHSETTGTRRMT